MEAEKINIIKTYLHKNGVKYYDIQAELIDHFATAIEREQQSNAKLSFKEALHTAHKKFGGKEGFRKFLEKAQESVNKKTWSMVGQTLLRFLTLPYLLLTLSIALAWYVAFNNFTFRADIVFGVITLLFLSVLLFNEIRLCKVPMFLPRKTTHSLGWVLYLVIYIPGNHIWISGDVWNSTFGIIYFTLLSITLISFYRVPEIAIRQTRKVYPQIA